MAPILQPTDATFRAVTALLIAVGREIVVPRYRGLSLSDIAEKSPGETVTIVDHEAEAALYAGLLPLLAGARIVGEEAAAANPTLMDGLGEGLVWLIDPLDGTSNFASGNPPFGIMVALVADGEAIRAWIHDPLTGRTCCAARGQGAMIDDKRVRTIAAQSGRPVAALATQFMTAPIRSGVERSFAEAFDLEPIPRCAAEHYARLVTGRNQAALFQRTLPWDHAAGALFLTEAGGRVARWDGSPYRIGDGGTGILAASDEASFRAAQAAMARVELSGVHIDPMLRRG